MKKIVFAVITTALISAGLTACFGHPNPLKQPDKHHVASVLVKASRYGERQLHLSDGAYGYSDCMEGKQKSAVCSQLYAEMVKYVEMKRELNGLTVQDLQDKKAWEAIRGRYKAMAFDSL